MRIVLDTNILLTSFSSRSGNHWVWENLVQGKFNLCLTHDILLEYEEIITRHASLDLALAVTDALLELPNVEMITKYFNWNLITVDPDDNKFVDCAIAARAHYIVSEDRHFSILQHVAFPKVNVIGIEEFKREILPA